MKKSHAEITGKYNHTATPKQRALDNLRERRSFEKFLSNKETQKVINLFRPSLFWTLGLIKSWEEPESELPSLEWKQIAFNDNPEINKAFIRAMFKANLQGTKHWFDKSSWDTGKKESDPDMNLDKFLKHFKSWTFLRLQVASPVQDSIRLWAHLEILNDGITRDMELSCPFNEVNHEIVRRLCAEYYWDNIIILNQC